MAPNKLLAVLTVLFASLQICLAFPKPGIKDLSLELVNPVNVSVKWMTLTLSENATIDFKGACHSAGAATVHLKYRLLITQCASYLDRLEESTVLQGDFGKNPVVGTEWVEIPLDCTASTTGSGDPLQFTEVAPERAWLEDTAYHNTCLDPAAGLKGNDTEDGADKSSKVPPNKPAANPTGTKKRSLSVSVSDLMEAVLQARTRRSAPFYKKVKKEVVCKTTKRQVFALVFAAQADPVSNGGVLNVTVAVQVEMKNHWGYLSALDYPNLVFYGIMTALYSLYAFGWLLALMCHYKDLLRVQFWIGAVIALGMVEKVFFFSEYNRDNAEGREGMSLLATAEMVSAGKRTLARLLVIIISLGFGIVRPRLGPNLVLVVGIGIVYFTAASVEGISRVVASSEEVATTKGQVMSLAIVLLDVGIIYFIYASITDTMRTLRLRRNTVKLSLYRHFSNAIVFAVVASVAFSTWAYLQFRSSACIKDWQEIWLLDGFWHILFSFLLLSMMVLWRPSANNNRYAYSPLVDLASNEDEPEQMPSDAFEGMKLRNLGQQRKTVTSSTVDDDLKWVEENIPTSLVEGAVPVLMDSEEEVVESRFQVSKMQ
ncbi:transmembrane protein 87B-like [Sycon ciliatum]|uniref:transmembrane protein 87B-like n=1 Tax=Sycon ciliatum TaxID=27933 RepID=UPI0031F6164D